MRETMTTPTVEYKKLNTRSQTTLFFGFAFFTLLFGCVGLWSALAEIRGAVIATGTVGISGEPKTIQHPDGGVVEKIFVKNGQAVQAGDTLILLDETILVSNVLTYEKQLQENMAMRLRLQAEQAGLLEMEKEDPGSKELGIAIEHALLESQKQILEVRRARLQGKISSTEQELKQLRIQKEGLVSTREVKTQNLKSLSAEAKNAHELSIKGFVAKNHALDLQRKVLDLENQISEHQSQILSVSSAMDEKIIRISVIQDEYFEDVFSKLRDVEIQISHDTDKLISAREKLKRIEIRAPVDGIVHELSIFTEGGVVPPLEPVLYLVPQSKELTFKVVVDPIYIDQIFIGQESAVIFTAFNVRTTPELSGHVVGMSPDTITDEATGAPYYTVSIEVSPAELRKLGDLQLLPGMPLEAFIATEARSPLNYLIRPLTDNLRRAARED